MTLSRKEMIDLQNSLIKKLISHAYHHTRYYKELMDSLNLKPNDISCKEDLKKLPQLTKSIIRQNTNNLISNDKYSKKLFKVATSGSTGTHTVIYKSHFYYQMNYAALLRCFMITGNKWRDRSVYFWSDPNKNCTVLKIWKNKVLSFLDRTIRFDTESYDENDFNDFFLRIRKFKPKMVFGKPTVILSFSKFLLVNSLKIDSVERIITTSSKLRDRNLIEEAFGASVYDLYSSAECYGIAIESEPNLMHVADDNVVLNINENGEFIITPLHSYGFPLINYRIGDFGTDLAKNTLPKSDLPFTEIRLIIGRTMDIFITSDGRCVSGGNIMDDVSKDDLEVEQQQFIQTDYEQFVINFVSELKPNEKYEKSIRSKFKKQFGENITITFNQIDTIKPKNGGKVLCCKRTFLPEKSFDGMSGLKKFQL